MNNDDKQLIKDIAVIHFNKCCYSIQERDDKIYYCHQTAMEHKEFNPLADTVEAKAFCWDLMVKNSLATFVHSYHTSITDYNHSVTLSRDESPQRAVLLAVRELGKSS